MRESLRISVPKPCGEDWEKMTPAGRGRHCEQCCKTVVDFTGMSDGEVLQFFKDRADARGSADSHGGVCGRFASDQLQRELAPDPVQRNGFKGWYLVLASAMMVAGKEEGRAPLKLKMEQRRGAPEDGQGGALRDTQGVSNLGTPVVLTDTVRKDIMVGEVVAPGVRCVKPDTIKQPTMGAVAVRTMGKVFRHPDTTANVPPDTTTGITILVGDTASYKKPPLDTASRVRVVVDAVVTAIRDTAAAVFPGMVATDDVVQIYPNPVARGGTIRLQWRASGRYAAALLDLHGQIQQEREMMVAGKGQVDEWAVPQGLAPGVYFLRVSRPGERAVTKELVIQ